ncbi:hypothetical protein [Streptomyces sp. NPDC054834]
MTCGPVRERQARWGWALSGDLQPHHQQAVEAAAGQGLAELADREMELSAHEGRPIVWAARLSPCGRDVLTYTDASPAPEQPHDTPASSA